MINIFQIVKTKKIQKQTQNLYFKTVHYINK